MIAENRRIIGVQPSDLAIFAALEAQMGCCRSFRSVRPYSPTDFSLELATLLADLFFRLSDRDTALELHADSLEALGKLFATLAAQLKTTR